MAILRIQVREEVFQKIGTLAHSQGCDTDQIVDEALNRYLQWHEGQMQLWEETEEAIVEGLTGEIIEEEEIFSWLDTWGQHERSTGP